MDYEKKQRLIALCNRMKEYGYTDGVEELESIFPQLAESEDENRKNNHGYYKAGKFWKASTLWEAVKGKIPQRVENRYVLQNCSWNIGTLREFAEEMRDVQEVNLDYPIILDMNGNILDGAHRVVKAYLEGKDIDIVYLGDDEWPEPDYDEEKAVKESKDKKIRGCIGVILTDATEQRFTDFGVSLKDCLAWLENQKEQKSEKLDGKALLHTADKSYEIGYRDGKMDAQKEMEIDVKDYRLRNTWAYIDKFIKKFGKFPKDIDELSACVDYVIKYKFLDLLYASNKFYSIGKRDGKKEAEQKPAEIDEYEIIKKHITEGSLSGEVNKRLTECGWYVTEQKPVECVEFDNEFKNQVSHLLASAFNGEYRYDKGFVDWAAQQLLGYAKNELKPTEWSEEDRIMLNTIIADVNRTLHSCGIGTDEHQIRSRAINFLKSLRPQPKIEWSEEEQQIIEDAACTLINFSNTVETREEEEELCELASKLQDIKPQPHWKPSEEQMKWLKDVIETVPMTCRQQVPLESLYVDLQKLL